MELLNQRIQVHEYDCALVCALAVLGRRYNGWRDPEDYPPILSKIIKIARFLVVLKAYRLDLDIPTYSTPLHQRRGDLGGKFLGVSPMEDPFYQFTGSQDSGYKTQGTQRTQGIQGSQLLPSSSSPPTTPDLGDLDHILRIGSSPRGKRSFQEWVELFMSSFMVKGTHGPMQWMLDLRTYGLRIHYNTTSPGHVGWQGQDQLLYKQYQFSMGEFRSLIHGLVAQAREILHEHLLLVEQPGAAQIPLVPWDSLRDDPTQGKLGWSFLQDSRTCWPVDGRKWLLHRFQGEAYLQRKWIRHRVGAGQARGTKRARGADQAWGTNGDLGANRAQGTNQDLGTQPAQLEINPKAANAYLGHLVRFREQLAVLIHLCSGQPARGTELLSIRAVNTEVGGHRNLFIEDGLVSLVTLYHKGFHLSGNTKVIHRYLPRELGELVIHYLWLVLPFAQHLEHLLQKQGLIPQAPARQAYLFPPDPNGREWNGNRLREALKKETRLGLHGQALNLQAYRNIAIAISRRFLRPSQAFKQDHEPPLAGDGDPLGLGEDDDDILDLQAGHPSHLAGAVYGRGLLEQPGVILEQREQFRLTSMDWHRFLGFASAYPSSPIDVGAWGAYRAGGARGALDLEAQGGWGSWGSLGSLGSLGKRKQAPFESDAEETRMLRRWQLMEADLEKELHQLMGRQDIQFQGVQAPALHAIKKGESPVVVVMPTGGGKSLLFMLPTYISQGGTTIVVVPLISLRVDLQHRCAQLGISCVAWESRRPPHAAQIVLVTPESALTEDFRSFLNRLRLLQQLDRLVVDECHLMLHDQTNFRPELAKLGQLASAQAQMVFLTATLPPSCEQELWACLGLARERIWLYQSPTRRGNICYQIHWYQIQDRTLQNQF